MCNEIKEIIELLSKGVGILTPIIAWYTIKKTSFLSSFEHKKILRHEEITEKAIEILHIALKETHLKSDDVFKMNISSYEEHNCIDAFAFLEKNNLISNAFRTLDNRSLIEVSFIVNDDLRRFCNKKLLKNPKSSFLLIIKEFLKDKVK